MESLLDCALRKEGFAVLRTHSSRFAGSVPASLLRLVLVVALAGATTGAAVFDSGTDFVSGPAPQSPASPWHYFATDRSATAFGTAGFVLHPIFSAAWYGAANLPAWYTLSNTADGSGMLYPVVAKNTSGSAMDPFGGLETPVPAGGILIHPSSTSNSMPGSALGWTCPFSGQFAISLSVTDADSSGGSNSNSDGVSWFLDLGSGGVLGASLGSGVIDADPSHGAPTTQSLSLPSVVVSTGQVLYLSINPIGTRTTGYESGRNHYFDSTLVSLTVTGVPEPATGAALTAALCGLLCRRPRTKGGCCL